MTREEIKNLGLKHDTYYIVDVAFDGDNDVHRSIMFVNIISENFVEVIFFNDSYDDYYIIDDDLPTLWYLSIVKELPEMQQTPLVKEQIEGDENK